MASKSKKKAKTKRKAPKKAKSKVFKPKKAKKKTMAKKKGSKNYRSKAKGMLSGTGGKVLIGAVAGMASSYLVAKAPPQVAAYADDVGDLVATFAGGKVGLVSNIVAKRVAAPIIAQLQGSGTPTQQGSYGFA